MGKSNSHSKVVPTAHLCGGTNLRFTVKHNHASANQPSGQHKPLCESTQYPRASAARSFPAWPPCAHVLGLVVLT